MVRLMTVILKDQKSKFNRDTSSTVTQMKDYQFYESIYAHQVKNR